MKNCIVCNKKSRLKLKRKGFLLFECTHCCMIFVDPDQIGNDYNQQYEKDISSPMLYYKNIKGYDKRTFLKRLQFLDKYFPKKGSLLEIGSNTGTFLEIAKEYGWDVSGVEPNKSICKDFIKKKKNISMYNDFFNKEFVKNHNRKYDLLYSSDVIEHIPDPISFLKNYKKLLKKDGIIVTITPDFDSFLTKLFQIKPTEHLIYLNKKNIELLFSKADLKIVEVRNIHRFRNIKAMLYSTTFTDGNNAGKMMNLVKLINILRLNYLVEFFIDLFKEDILIISKPNNMKKE
jgi:2-polyprenyl-3-methyl-5-hydroxy-6-metoxy-1,4-benzoquinol methylase